MAEGVADADALRDAAELDESVLTTTVVAVAAGGGALCGVYEARRLMDEDDEDTAEDEGVTGDEDELSTSEDGEAVEMLETGTELSG